MRLIRIVASIVVLAQLTLGWTAAQSCEHSTGETAAGQHHAPVDHHGSDRSPACDHAMMLGCSASASCGIVTTVGQAGNANLDRAQGEVPSGRELAPTTRYQRPDPPPPRA